MNYPNSSPFFFLSFQSVLGPGSPPNIGFLRILILPFVTPPPIPTTHTIFDNFTVSRLRLVACRRVEDDGSFFLFLFPAVPTWLTSVMLYTV